MNGLCTFLSLTFTAALFLITFLVSEDIQLNPIAC